MHLSEEKLLTYFQSHPQPLSLRSLRRAFRLSPRAEGPLLHLLTELCEQNRLSLLSDDRYQLTGEAALPVAPTARRAEAHASLRTGVLQLQARGFGFVRLDGAEADVYIAAEDLADARHRDRVRLQLLPGDPQRPAGRIVAVLDRGTHSFIGFYRREGRGAAVYPQDARLPQMIPCAVVADLDEGSLVAAQFMHDRAQPEALRCEVLHPISSDQQQGMEQVLYEHGLRMHFAPEVLAEARSAQLDVEAVLRSRRDLRALPLFTVDPQSARDFDDALHAELLDQGGWRLTVAIADVSHYVPQGGALDEEAKARGCSVYLPERVVPMLPHELSSGLCSLQPGQPRLAIVVQMDVSPDGQLSNTTVFEALVQSHQRLSYEQAGQLLALQPKARGTDLAARLKQRAQNRAHPALEALLAATRARRRWRAKRGYLNLNIAEARVFFDADGEIEDIRAGERTEAHQMVEDAMLAANETLADWFVEHALPSVFRVHDRPTGLAHTRFCQQVGGLGAPYDTSGRLTPHTLNGYLKRHQGHPQEVLLNQLLLRSMAKAVYSAQPNPHFGLGAPLYLHFTSPIRRYSDLTVHRLLKAHWAQEPRTDAEQLVEVAEQCNQRERAASEAEWAVLDLYKARYLSKHIGAQFEGLVINVLPIGLFVQLQPHLVEGLVPAEALPGAGWQFDKKLGAFVHPKGQRAGLGLRLKVQVKKVDLSSRRVELGWVETLDEPAPQKARKGRRS